MGGGEAVRVVAGIGCARGCEEDDILAVLAAARTAAGREPRALATPSFKRDEPAIAAAARRLGLDLLLIDEAALAAAQARCPTRSAWALTSVGIGSVAEGCALAAAGAGGRLLLARVAAGRATCALAEAPR